MVRRDHTYRLLFETKTIRRHLCEVTGHDGVSWQASLGDSSGWKTTKARLKRGKNNETNSRQRPFYWMNIQVYGTGVTKDIVQYFKLRLCVLRRSDNQSLHLLCSVREKKSCGRITSGWLPRASSSAWPRDKKILIECVGNMALMTELWRIPGKYSKGLLER